MKKILFIAQAAYPVTSAESIVNIKLLKVLSDGGFKIDLVSKQLKGNYPNVDLHDKLKLNSIHVIKVDNRITLKTIWQHILSFFIFGVAFKGSHWAVAAKKTVDALLKANEYDYILTKSDASYLLGFYAKRKYKKEWIATWNDPYPYSKYPVPYGKGANAQVSITEKQQISIMRNADRHIFPSDRLRDYMIQYLDIDKSCCSVIPHVVVVGDSNVNVPRKNSCLKIIHSGNLSYPRNPILFFEALSMFFRANPSAQLKVCMLGVLDNSIDVCLENYGLKQVVSVHPPVDYLSSLKMLKDYQVGMIIEAPCHEGIFLPTKVSDFMQAGINIFAISPSRGVLNDLYKNHYIDYFASCTDKNEIYETLERIYNDFLNGKLPRQISIPKSYLPHSVIDQYNLF